LHVDASMFSRPQSDQNILSQSESVRGGLHPCAKCHACTADRYFRAETMETGTICAYRVGWVWRGACPECKHKQDLIQGRQLSPFWDAKDVAEQMELAQAGAVATGISERCSRCPICNELEHRYAEHS
jgi:hypothetical protein